MDCREWMYTGRLSQSSITNEWLDKTEAFLNKHLVGLKEEIVFDVLATVVQMVRGKQGRPWVNIFARMDLWKAIPGGSCMVKQIA
jgi:hypothetical protein